MEFLLGIFRNPFFIVSVSSWFVAQFLKTVLYAIENKKWDWMRLFGDGGMPSGHSATVTALAVSSGLRYGLGSFQFAVTGILAVIVMHDAMGVRQESGKHAEILNKLIDNLHTESLLHSVPRLKELLGHTPLQVAGGTLVGLCTALLVC